MTIDIDAAVDRYERGATLGEAARLAGVNRWEMQDILRDREVELRIGLADEDDAEDEVDAADSLDIQDDDREES